MAIRTVKSSGGDYTSLAAWEAGRQGVLSEIETAECYSFLDTAAVTIDGWTTTSSFYIRIYAPTAERHIGVWNTGKYRLEGSNPFDGLLIINEQYTRLEGLQIRNTGASGHAVALNAANCLIESTIGRGTDQVFRSYSGSNGSIYRNCIGYGGSAEAFYIAFGETLTFQNCTGAGGTYGWSDNDGTSTCTNCYARGTTGGYNGVGTITTSGASNTSGSPAGLDNVAYSTVNFANVTAGSEDLRLVSGSALIGSGTDLSGTFTVDIAGNTRSVPFDVGAHEYVSAAAARLPSPVIITRQANTTAAFI
jgi:hypothetical protein